MTIDKNFETVTFWEPVKHIQYKLEGRINRNETEWLKNYLSPQLTVKEKKKFRQKSKKVQKQKEKEKELQRLKEEKEKEEAEKKLKNQKKKGAFKNLTMLNELMKVKEYDARNQGKNQYNKLQIFFNR